MSHWKRAVISSLLALCASSAAWAADFPEVDLARAEEISMGRCFLCHGAEGESTTALYPRLAGQHYQYIAKQLADFKAGRRQSDTMVNMAADLSPEEMLALGVYFEQKPTRAQDVQDGELAAIGRFIFRRGNEYSGVAACASCHGERGLGTSQLPRLAGQVPQYIERQLRSFNTRNRTNDNAVMHSIASRLTELEIRSVALYISSLN
ncbi:cytochrome c, class I [Parazoarcus communis]|jgi:cytochrome c553|uniref:Cytochrome c, class I n=1 Tax=Parazoarcus communis TaxID=41977 RepID=A0A2U8GWY0_9RHOO|nr:c-type cytochrome [Parazoarcus communis]AWI77944.1 cytochrome c, class I [Parazoarcus communis]